MKNVFSFFMKNPLVILGLFVCLAFTIAAFNTTSKVVSHTETLLSPEGNEVEALYMYDDDAMRSSMVYSFTIDTLTNSESTTFTIPDVFTNPYDLLVQGLANGISGSPTLIFQTQVSTADSGDTFFWTTVQSDTLTATGSFVVNTGAPASIVIPRTIRRCRVLVNQTGTAVSSVDLQVSAKRWPN